MESVLGAGVPALMVGGRHPIMQGWMPPLVGSRHRSSRVLLTVDACLGLLLVVMPISTC
jgi:hypothetical protein